MKRRSFAIILSSLVAAYAVTSFLAESTGCVDGATPDCSDAQSGCGPEVSETGAPLDGALLDGAGDGPAPEAGTEDAARDASTGDARDGGPDADTGALVDAKSDAKG